MAARVNGFPILCLASHFLLLLDSTYGLDCKWNLLSKSKTEKTVSPDKWPHLDRKLLSPQPRTVFSVGVCNSDGVYEKDKERLANMMAFGQDIVPSSAESSKVVRRLQKPEAESDEEIDRFQERKKPVRYEMSAP